MLKCPSFMLLSQFYIKAKTMTGGFYLLSIQKQCSQKVPGYFKSKFCQKPLVTRYMFYPSKNYKPVTFYYSLFAFIPENTLAGKIKTALNESHSHAHGWIHHEPLHWPFAPGLCQAPAASLGKQALNLVQAQLLVKLGLAIEAAVILKCVNSGNSQAHTVTGLRAVKSIAQLTSDSPG